MSETRKQLEDWLSRIEIKGGRILDVGGAQNPLNSKRLGIFKPDDYKILDLEIPHKCKQKPDIIFDINEAGGSIHYKYFNIIFCLEVTEYIWNPFQAFKNFYKWLDKDGILYLSTHFIYPQHEPFEEDCLRYTPKGIEKLLNKAGFEIIGHKYRMASNKYLISFYEYDKMRGIKDVKCNHNIIGSLIKAKKV